MSVPLPHRMRDLPQERGYPVPVIVMDDTSGKPIFAANDENIRQRMFREDRCHICGGRLARGRWFVGGQLSACCLHGQFMDGGLHGECARYALRVCPYLAAPQYGRLVGPVQLAHRSPDVVTLTDDTRDNARPDIFVALMAVAQEPTYATIDGMGTRKFVRLVRPKLGSVRQVEVWRHGETITDRATLDRLRERCTFEIAAIGDVPRPDVWERWP